MNTHREIAYRLDPALWMREVLGINAARMAGDISARAARRIYAGLDGSAGW